MAVDLTVLAWALQARALLATIRALLATIRALLATGLVIKSYRTGS